MLQSLPRAESEAAFYAAQRPDPAGVGNHESEPPSDPVRLALEAHHAMGRCSGRRSYDQLHERGGIDVEGQLSGRPRHAEQPTQPTGPARVQAPEDPKSSVELAEPDPRPRVPVAATPESRSSAPQASRDR